MLIIPCWQNSCLHSSSFTLPGGKSLNFFVAFFQAILKTGCLQLTLYNENRDGGGKDRGRNASWSALKYFEQALKVSW